jgi:multicomponent Na+:H+ antiporter subunit G
MSLVLDIASWALLMTGAIFLLIGAVGIIRMPDFYTRLHPAGIIDTLGAGLILAGLTLQAGWTLIAAKLVLIFLLLMLTSPTTCHATARAALAAALRPKLGRDG